MLPYTSTGQNTVDTILYASDGERKLKDSLLKIL